MPSSDQSVTIDINSDTSLQEVFNTNELPLPYAINISDNLFHFNCHSTHINTPIELVVFTTLTIFQLANIASRCKLDLLHLTAINHRNGATSARLSVQCSNLQQAREALINICLSEEIDAALIENAPSLALPGLLVMDMDSTTIEIECIDEIAKLAGVGEKVAAVTELAMQGQLDFAQSLHQRVATLTHAPASILAEVANNIPLMSGLIPLIRVLKQYGWKIAIASGGFTYFADHLKDALDLDDAFANTLEIIDSTLTGKVLGEVVDANAKAQVLTTLADKYHLPSSQTVAMGDGANDLVMMAAAHLGVAYKAKPLVLKKADTSISYTGLDCLLHWLK